MELGLVDKTALVLGASGGLGAAIARCLASEGVRVAAASRSREGAEATVASIEKGGGRAIPLNWNLADLSQIERQITAIESLFGSVDILINNTGGPPPTSASNQEPQLWQTHFQMIVLSVIAITDRILPRMREKRWGRIITSTSSGVVVPISNLAISNALRLSLLGWSKTLASEVARDGITVNVIVPGRIATRRVSLLDQSKAERAGRPVEEVVSQSVANIPTGRYGDPQEYADVVTFIASARASYLTGSVVRVDGGMIPSI